MKKIETINKENRYPYQKLTTMEKLQVRASAEAAVLKFGDKVLMADYYWKGFVAGVYEFIETPEETGLGECECRISLIAKSEGEFADGGHAVAWALAQAQ